MPDPVGDSSQRIDYGRVAEDYETTRGIPADLMKELIEDIIRTCNLNHDSLVLELGCGTGRFLRELSGRKIPVAGIDISKGMLERAHQNQQSQRYFRSHLIASDAISLPFHRGLFVGVIAIHLFHLFSDWQQALIEAIRVLQPGGRLLTGYIEASAYGSSLTQFYGRRKDELGYSLKRLGAHPPEVLEELKTMGAVIETHEFSRNVEVPLRVTLAGLERRVFPSMWNLPDVIHRQIMQEVKNLATSQFKDSDYEEKIHIKTELHFAAFG